MLKSSLLFLFSALLTGCGFTGDNARIEPANGNFQPQQHTQDPYTHNTLHYFLVKYLQDEPLTSS